MTRDDSSGGWVPLSGGGLANVSVRRRTPLTNSGHPPGSANGTGGISASTPATPSSNTDTNSDHGTTNMSPPSAAKRRHEYLIYGIRIKDQSVIYIFFDY